MALVDEGLEKGEREELARTLHATPKPVQPRKGKPEFPYLDFCLDPEPSPPPLATLVTPDTWAIFNRLELRGSNVRSQTKSFTHLQFFFPPGLAVGSLLPVVLLP